MAGKLEERIAVLETRADIQAERIKSLELCLQAVGEAFMVANFPPLQAVTDAFASSEFGPPPGTDSP